MLISANGQHISETVSAAEIRGRSPWRDAARRLTANRAALVAVYVLALVILIAVLGPYLSAYDYDTVDWDNMGVPPGLKHGHLLGTDSLGFDVYVRTLHGVRISLLIAVVATAVSLIIGTVYGATAGYIGGRTDGMMMRFVDIMYALPFVFFVLVLLVWFGRNIFLIFAAIGAVEWLTMARIVRGQTLSLKKREFVEAARAIGLSTPRIIARHIVPNLMGPVIVYATLTVPQVILFESFLSYLGLGVQPPLTSLGVLISDGVAEMETRPWLLIVPGSVLVVVLLCFNFIGDGLRDALDPKDRR